MSLQFRDPSLFLSPSNILILYFQDKTLDALATIRPTEGVHVDCRKWLAGDPLHSFASWRQRMPSKPAEPPAPPTVTEAPKKLTKVR